DSPPVHLHGRPRPDSSRPGLWSISAVGPALFRRLMASQRRKRPSDRLQSSSRPRRLSPMKTDTPASSPGLIRALGPLMATAVVVGTVIGSGIFKKPQVVASNIPYFGLAATVWVIGGLLALMGALALAEVAVLFPKAGGNYVFLREGYGRLAGFLWGWVEFWIIRCASLAALATIFTESLHALLRELIGPSVGEWLGYWSQRLLTVGVIMGLALVNVRGVRWGGVLQFLITTVKVGSLLF